jgi:hypothetical protein
VSEWISVQERLPEFERRVLLLWEKTEHIEDGKFYPSEHVDGEWYHVLFDGESMNDAPSHWMPYPGAAK